MVSPFQNEMQEDLLQDTIVPNIFLKTKSKECN